MRRVTLIRSVARWSFYVVLVSVSACGSWGDDGEPKPDNNDGGTGPGGSGASSGSASGSGGTSAGTGGASGSAGTGGSAGGGEAAPTELPEPPGDDDLAAPSGDPGGLEVLDWAGFDAAVSYTIDDSQPSQVAHFPELDATGVRMTFYLNPSNNWIASYDATWQAALAAGHELGNHTVNHCHADLSGCNANLGTVDAEIDDCSSYITTKLGQPEVWTFAFPFGDTGFESYAKTRFLLARGVGSGMIAPGDATDPFNLPIVAAAGSETAEVFSEDIDVAVEQGRWLIFLFHSILPTADNWYAGVDIGSITGSIAHAEEAGNVWLDSVVNVGAYWVGQRLVEEALAGSDGTTLSWTLPPFFPRGRKVRVVVDGGTPSQDGTPLEWDGHGYYEVLLDAGSLTLGP